MPRVLALSLVVLAIVPGCGDDGLSAARRDRLHERIADAREAAGSRDAAGARRALVAFRRDVRAARESGELSAADADRLLRGALQASRRVRVEVTPAPTSTPAPTATAAPTAFAPAAPSPPPAAPDKAPKGEGKGKGKGKEHGKGKKE